MGASKVLKMLLGMPGIDAKKIPLQGLSKVEVLDLLLENGADPKPLFDKSKSPTKEHAIVYNMSENGEPGTMVLILRVGPKYKMIDISKEQVESATVEVWKKYLMVDHRNEMGDEIGSLLFSRDGTPLDISKVHKMRKKLYPFSERCVMAHEFGNELVFWDLEHDNEPYNCYNGSQTSPGSIFEWHIPRYYRFNPKTGSLKMIPITANICPRLTFEGKIACQKPPPLTEEQLQIANELLMASADDDDVGVLKTAFSRGATPAMALGNLIFPRYAARKGALQVLKQLIKNKQLKASSIPISDAGTAGVLELLLNNGAPPKSIFIPPKNGATKSAALFRTPDSDEAEGTLLLVLKVSKKFKVVDVPGDVNEKTRLEVSKSEIKVIYEDEKGAIVNTRKFAHSGQELEKNTADQN